jgi:hypothetical protein
VKRRDVIVLVIAILVALSFVASLLAPLFAR